MHNGLGDLELFGALHINDTMANVIALHEGVQIFWERIFLDKGAEQNQYDSPPVWSILSWLLTARSSGLEKQGTRGLPL